jgi:uncharacterized membrane protein YeiH
MYLLFAGVLTSRGGGRITQFLILATQIILHREVARTTTAISLVCRALPAPHQRPGNPRAHNAPPMSLCLLGRAAQNATTPRLPAYGER